VNDRRLHLRSHVEADVPLAALRDELVDFLLHPRAVETWIGRDERGNGLRAGRAGEPYGFRDFLGRAEHQVVEANRVDAQFFGDVHHLVQRLERSWATVVLMLTRRARASRASRSSRRGRSNAPFTPRARRNRAVDRDADVFEKTLAGELGHRVGALGRDDRAVGREVPADVALLAEDIHHRQDVLAHEDLAAGEADLQPAVVGKGAGQRVDRQLLTPLALDVQEIADVAELAVQVAPHGRFIHDA
jgi:hypothetical protein